VRLRYDEKSETEHKHDDAKDVHANGGTHSHDGHSEPDGHGHSDAAKPTAEQADAFFMDMGHLFHHVQATRPIRKLPLLRFRMYCPDRLVLASLCSMS